MTPTELMKHRDMMLNHLSKRPGIEKLPLNQCIAAAEEWLLGAGVPVHQVREALGKKTVKRINQLRFGRSSQPARSAPKQSPDRIPTKQFAKCLRTMATTSERILWTWLHERSGMRGWVFQHPALDYVIDFYHPKTRIGIELDGSFHTGREKYDARRDARLKDHGIRIIRVPSSMMFSEPSFVYRSIKQAVDAAMGVNVKSATALLKKEANGTT